MAKDTALVIAYFSQESVKLAFIKRSPQLNQVDDICVIEAGEISDQDLTQRIRDALVERKALRKDVFCVLPPGVTTTKNIEVPSTDPQEIKSIIDLQAGRHTPFSREEIIIGYVNFGVYQKNYSKILLAIVNRKTVLRQIDILQDAGLAIQHVFFTPEMTAGFYANLFELSSGDAPVGLINIGKNDTDFTIMLRKNPIACRNLPVGFDHIEQDPQASQEKFVDELKRSIDSYRKEDIEQAPKECVLFDANSQVKELQTYLKTHFETPLRTISYLDRIVVSSQARAAMEEHPNENFLDVIAPGFYNQPARIDFLPDEIRMQRAIEDQGRQGIKFGALMIIFLILACTILLSRVYFKNTLLEKMNAEYATTEQEARALEKVSTKTRIVKAYLNSRLVPLEVLRELYRIIPHEIYLQTLILDENGQVVVEGTSDSMSQVFALVGTLENSELFKGVKTKSTTAKKERGKDVASFEIVFSLEGAPQVDSPSQDKSTTAEE